jgi:hypothetical protein
MEFNVLTIKLSSDDNGVEGKNMKIETLKDVLSWTQGFHESLSTCMQHCGDKNVSRRSKLLLDYLAKHETHLADVVERFSQQASSNALNTWCYEYLEKHPIIHKAAGQEPFSEISSLEITEVIMEQHRQVIELYRYLYSRADAPSAVELLKQLLDLEEHEVMQMAQSANRLEDL